MGIAFKLLRQKCREGDRVVITSSTGTTEGRILEIDEHEVALETDDGGFSCISDSDVISVRTITVKASLQPTPLQPAPPQPTPPQPAPSQPAPSQPAPSPPAPSQASSGSQQLSQASQPSQSSQPSQPSPLPADAPSVKPATAAENVDKMIREQWRNDPLWRRQVYSRMLAVIDRQGDYASLAENRKTLPEKGRTNPSVPAIIMEKTTGTPRFYDSKHVLLPFASGNLPVFFEKDKNGSLINILPARKVSDLIDMLRLAIERETFNRDPWLPLRVLGIIEELVPDSHTVSAIYDGIENALKRLSHDGYTPKVSNATAQPAPTSAVRQAAEANYKKATDLRIRKRPEEALGFFLKAVQGGYTTESCIKNTSMTYNTLYKQARLAADPQVKQRAEEMRREAIDFMKKYSDKLQDNISTLYYLENFYYSMHDYENFLKVMERLMMEREVSGNNSRKLWYLNKQALAYIELHKYGKAREMVDQALAIDSGDIGTQKLKATLDEQLSLKNQLQKTQDEEKISELRQKEQEIQRRMDEQSKLFTILPSAAQGFMAWVLEDYDQMFAVPDDVKASCDYTERTLNTVQSGFDRNVRRDKIRTAEYSQRILTELKIMQMLGYSEHNGRTVEEEMSHYCEAMGDRSLYDNLNLDVVRFYYEQSFALLPENGSVNERYLSAYLQTLIYKSETIRENLGNRPKPVNEILTEIFKNDIENIPMTFWEILLSLTICHNNVAVSIVGCLYENDQLREQALRALREWGIADDATSVQTLGDFTKAWDKMREKRRNERSSLITDIKNCGGASDKIYDLIANLTEKNIEKWRQVSWLQRTLDFARIGTIRDNLISQITAFSGSRNFLSKTNTYNSIKNMLKEEISDISNKPTQVSFEGLLPLLRHVEGVVDKEYSVFYEDSTPKVNISLLNMSGFKDGELTLQIEVNNEKETSAPIRNVEVNIKLSDDILECRRMSDNDVTIDGGKSNIFEFVVRVSEQVAQQGVGIAKVTCNHDGQQEPDTELSLTLYSRDDFMLINTPYSTGRALKPGDPTFVGRRDKIDDIIKSVTEGVKRGKNAQIILYGQKRSGKSSVLNFLSKELSDKGFFCISFTLEQGIGSLHSFYRQILYEMQKNLDRLRKKERIKALHGEKAEDIPEFTCPDLETFKAHDEVPMNTFREYMEKFQEACDSTPGWENRQVVMMIDEFTYAYEAIVKGKMDDSIMRQWKAFTELYARNLSVILVGQDITPEFLKQPYAVNASRVLSTIRLTYLSKEEAEWLIREPMKKACGYDPYIGTAVERIIEYTSRTPYYIQYLCNELVEYMNHTHSRKVSQLDIDILVKEMKWDKDMFDNLLNGGEFKEMQGYEKKKHVTNELLTAIAQLTNIPGYEECAISDVKEKMGIQGDEDREKLCDKCIEDLKTREVIEVENNKCKIQAKLFKSWLLKNSTRG